MARLIFKTKPCVSSRKSHYSPFFTLAYGRLSNGTVDRQRKQLILLVRTVLFELNQLPGKWPQLISFIQSAVNNSPSLQLDSAAPNTSFTGRPSVTQISPFPRSADSLLVTLTESQRERNLKTESLVKEIDDPRPHIEHSLT